MALGEAYVEVHADLRPFIRDLDRQLKTAVTVFEKHINASLKKVLGSNAKNFGDQLGKTLGDGFDSGFTKKTVKKSSSIFVSIASALASALDDGISALPKEVKAGLVAGIIAALPIAGALLTGLLVAAIGVAVTGLGVLLGAQFEQVQERAVEFGRSVREILVRSADAFGPAIIGALDMIEGTLARLAPTLNSLFDTTAPFLGTLTQALVSVIEDIVVALEKAAPKLEPFIQTLAAGFIALGETIGDVITVLTATGEDGRYALGLLITAIRAIIMGMAGVLFLMTKFIGFLRDFGKLIINLVSPLTAVFDLFVDTKEGQTSLIQSNTELEGSFNGVIDSTKGQERSLKDLNAEMERYSEAVKNNIEVDIAFEESLDRISESLKENGRNLRVQDAAGRENLRAFLDGLRAAEERALHRLQVQGYTAQQASALYNQEIAAIKQLALNAGITEKQFDDLFGEIITVAGVRISPDEMGVTGLSNELQHALDQARALQGVMSVLDGVSGIDVKGPGGFAGYADGDIINRPTVGLVGEAGPEVIIPLTKPARAAQLARDSGLTAILGGSGTQVLVFIGSEQLETRMVRVVERNNKNQATALAQGPRGF